MLKKIGLSALAVALLGAFGFYLYRLAEAPPQVPETVDLETLRQEAVMFPASDGYPLHGTFWPVPGADAAPALILTHQYLSTRRDFETFAPMLVEAGFAVLSYDTRGHGESAGGSARIEDFPLDVAGAILYLQSRPDVDMARIGIVGASVGANVAYVAAGTLPEIQAAVALSPANTGRDGVLMGDGVRNFAPRNLFVASDEKEEPAARYIYDQAAEPKKLEMYPGYGHGVTLLENPDAVQDILHFLRGRLRPEAAGVAD